MIRRQYKVQAQGRRQSESEHELTNLAKAVTMCVDMESQGMRVYSDSGKMILASDPVPQGHVKLPGHNFRETRPYLMKLLSRVQHSGEIVDLFLAYDCPGLDLTREEAAYMVVHGILQCDGSTVE